MKPEQLIETLVGLGKATGLNLLDSAVKTSESPEQLSNQVFVAQVAACHVLAHCAFNQEKQNQIPGDEWLDKIMEQIKADLSDIRAAHVKGEVSFQIPVVKPKVEIVKP